MLSNLKMYRSSLRPIHTALRTSKKFFGYKWSFPVKLLLVEKNYHLINSNTSKLSFPHCLILLGICSGKLKALVVWGWQWKLRFQWLVFRIWPRVTKIFLLYWPKAKQHTLRSGHILSLKALTNETLYQHHCRAVVFG